MTNKREQERERLRSHRLEREESEAEGQERRQRLLKLAVAVAFVAIIAVVVAVVVSQNQSTGGSTTLTEVGQVDSLLKGISQEGTMLGDPKAKVTLYEFGDLQCPICKEYSEQVLPQIIAGPVRSGEAKLEFRNFTIVGTQSPPAGAAALAAGKQGRGWNFIELFYRNQGTEGSGYVTDSFLTEIAKGAGVKDIAKWNTDRKSKSIKEKVARTTAQAESLGFTGTPSFAVEGPRTNGLRTLGTPGSAEALEEAVERAG